MAAKQRTFEGSNLPALVNKIMKGQYAPLRGNYSDAFRQLVININVCDWNEIEILENLLFQVNDLLLRDPAARPSADQIFNKRLPPVCL